MYSMTAGAELAVFGPRTRLFEAYGNYLKRIDRATRKPRPEPITEFREALVLLYAQMNDRTLRYLHTEAELPDGTRGPAICIEVYNGGYGGDLFSGADNFPVTEEVVQKLLRAGVLSGTPHMGYTDMKKLRLNEASTDRIIEEAMKYEDEHPPEPKAT